MPLLKKNITITLSYLAVCITWGTTYLAMRVAVAGDAFPPFLFAGIRFCIAGGIVTAFAKLTGKEFPITPADIGKTALAGIILLLGCNGLVMNAERWVHSGITCLLLSATPFFTSIIESFFLKEDRLKPSGYLFLFTGFGGVALLIFAGKGIGSIDTTGSVMLLCAALLWAIGSVYVRKFPASGSTVSLAGIQMLAAGIGLLIMGFSAGEGSRVAFHWSTVWAMAYLIIFGSIIGYGCNLYLLKAWSASKAVTSSYVNPVVAVIAGALLLSEPVNGLMLLSMAIVIGSVVLFHFVGKAKVK
jgi:drug/metabolite transporter (DMT)-like permease